VYNPTALVFESHLTLRDYLSRAGGPTHLADDESIMVIRVDGSVLTESGFASSRKSAIFPLLPVMSADLRDARLGPGDTIYVPEKLVFVDNVAYAKDIAQIAANAAASLATIGLLAFAL
jgi:protein involved in polysaccharide export with SLBB domain